VVLLVEVLEVADGLGGAERLLDVAGLELALAVDRVAPRPAMQSACSSNGLACSRRPCWKKPSSCWTLWAYSWAMMYATPKSPTARPSPARVPGKSSRMPFRTPEANSWAT
jgi:hypothetical protein